MFHLTGPVIALCIMAPALAYFVVKWLYQKDTEIENRRKAAGKLAATLKSYGLKWLPNFLFDYSVGDYSGMLDEIHKLAQLFNESEDMVVKEFDAVFANVLDAKLATPEGQAMIAAKLAAAAAPVAKAAATAAAAVAA